MIARLENSSQRIFPPIQPALYRPNHELIGLTPDRQGAQQLLSLSQREFTRWQLWCGWKLDAEGRLAHLLLQHRLAIEAELAAQWQQADFYWNQVYIELKLFSDKAWWTLARSIADQPGVTVINDAIQLRQRLVDELLIDAHCALYNGLVQQEKNISPNDRAFVHIDYIQRLLAFSTLTREEAAVLLKSPWQDRIRVCRKQGKWQQARQICLLRLRYLPLIEYQNELAEVTYSAAIAQTSPAITRYRAAAHFKQIRKFVLQWLRVLLTQLSHKNLLHPTLIHLWRNLQGHYSAVIGRIRQIAGRIYRLKDAKALQRAITDLRQRWQKLLRNPKMAQFQQNIAQSSQDSRLNYLYTVAHIHQEISRIKQLKDAKILRRCILALEKQCQDYPLNLKVFQFLSELHYQRAIKLRNVDRFSQALVTLLQAIAYNPDYDKPAHLRDELVIVMQQLMAEMSRFKMSRTQQLRAILINPIKILEIIRYERLRKEAKTGFAPLHTYFQSSTAEVTANNFRLAKAIDLWRNIGLAEPTDQWKLSTLAVMQNQGSKKVVQKIDGSAEQALLLLDAVNQVRSQPLTSRDSVVDAWQSVLTKYPKLANCDSPLVQAFLERQLFGTRDASITTSSETGISETRVPKPGTAEAALNLSHNPSDNAPILIPLFDQPKLEPEPLLPWLFSHQDIRLKAQATIASLLVLTTGGLLIRESIVRTTRNTTYQQILLAHQQQEYLAVLEGAEAFLNHTPLNGKDNRSQQVKQLYSEALVRWLAQQSHQPRPDAQKRIDRYQVLTNNARSGVQQ